MGKRFFSFERHLLKMKITNMPADPTTMTAETPNTTRRKPMWFGWSLAAWESIFFFVTASAALLGAFGLAAAFASAIIGYKISDEVTRDANLEIAAANERTEQARTETVALARAAAPRHVVFPSLPGSGGTTMLGSLSELGKFHDTPVSIQAADDTDAINFANELATALKALGWKPEIIDEKRSHVLPMVLMQGVSVLYPVGKPYKTGEPPQPWFAWHDAAEALADALTKSGFGLGDIPVERAGFVNKKQDFTFLSIPFFDPPMEGVYLQVGPRPISMTFQWVEQRRKSSP
jgi:hypothetical protein